MRPPKPAAAKPVHRHCFVFRDRKFDEDVFMSYEQGPYAKDQNLRKDVEQCLDTLTAEPLTPGVDGAIDDVVVGDSKFRVVYFPMKK
jgi:hypothetical protein